MPNTWVKGHRQLDEVQLEIIGRRYCACTSANTSTRTWKTKKTPCTTEPRNESKTPLRSGGERVVGERFSRKVGGVSSSVVAVARRCLVETLDGWFCRRFHSLASGDAQAGKEAKRSNGEQRMEDFDPAWFGDLSSSCQSIAKVRRRLLHYSVFLLRCDLPISSGSVPTPFLLITPTTPVLHALLRKFNNNKSYTRPRM
ncbi:hypothetical protein GEV33_003259 [Tenebrio molitor]|uniref:Uncharacterized protein n=1 Tax=Tenebrio molitor TaxID=7067 RepID=A0A8J6LHZ6_TENMO|nr:hypothetical protein GEV33_003259 [Tenebrio molitor]